MKVIHIGARSVGEGQPALIVAEIGINHNGDVALAKRMIEAAAESGADAVKFQNYRTEDFLRDRTRTYEYVSQGRTVSESQYDMFKRCELPVAALRELKDHCDACGVMFHGTPTSLSGIGDLADVGAPVLKNGSDFLSNLALVRGMGQSGMPTVLSTGMATLAEIDEAVRVFRATGNAQLILLHCTSVYPTPPAQVHLRKMNTLASAFGCLVGLSDHSEGVTAALGATALGACWIEKHFTVDKHLPGPDHRFSADPGEMATLVRGVRDMEACLGQARIAPAPSELCNRNEFRLSCAAARTLPADHVLGRGDLALQRPGTGLPSSWIPVLCGRKLNRVVEAGETIQWSDVR